MKTATMVDIASPGIPESYFEYRADFSEPIFEVWTVPNPLVYSLFSTLKRWNVGLGDVAWNKDPSSYKDVQLTFNVPKMNAIVRVGLDAATFIAVNPDWSKAPALVELFEAAMSGIQQTARVEVASQEIALGMHVTPGERKFGDAMAKLVNTELLGSAQTYGISAYREDSSLVIDKSVKYEGGIFVRLHRKFPATTAFTEVAMALYKDEVKALELLGVQELIQE